MADKKTRFGELSSKAKTAIIDAVEQQIKWLDSNPRAKIEELRTHKKQLEQAVIRTMTQYSSQTTNSNATQKHSHPYEDDL